MLDILCTVVELRQETFKETMKFDVYILDYHGSTEWIEPTVLEIKDTLHNDIIPQSNEDCETCSYVDSVANFSKTGE